MHMLDKIDAFLLKRLYQPLVDVSQKNKGWWVEQCSYLYFIASLLWLIVPDGKEANSHIGFWAVVEAVILLTFIIFISVGMSVAFWLTSRSEYLQSLAAKCRITIFCVAGVTIPVICLHSERAVGFRALELVQQVVYISVFYFCACDRPKPRQKKQTSVHTKRAANAI